MTQNILIITAVSGVGKTSLMNNLREEMPDLVRFIQATTSRPREARDSDLDYRFVSQEKFEEEYENLEYLYRKDQQGYSYAVRVADMRAMLADPEHLYVRSVTPDVLHLFDACAPGRICFIHLSSPGNGELRRRMRARGDKLAKINRKLRDECDWDMQVAKMKQNGFDIVIIPGHLPQPIIMAKAMKLLSKS